MKLNDYLRGKGLTEEDAASELDCSVGAIRKWKAGDRIPRPSMIARIHDWSEGSITFQDWCEVSAPVEAAA